MRESAGVSREWPRTACDGCGRTDVKGEYVELWTSIGESRRVGWSGCVDCWTKGAPRHADRSARSAGMVTARQ